jgi:thiamine biosynthesis lipoprotein
LEEARLLVGYQFVGLDPEHRTVTLAKAGMRLDVGGIAKGYVVDQALAELRKHGITRAMIHAGGDIGLGDPPPGESGWRIGVGLLEHEAKPTGYLTLARCGVANSGDMYQFVEIGGRRYSHLVDPRTGIGLTDHANVTVVAPSGLMADGLSTTLSVLGPEKGLKLIEETTDAAAFILRMPDGKLESCQSSRWKDLPVAPDSPDQSCAH